MDDGPAPAKAALYLVAENPGKEATKKPRPKVTPDRGPTTMRLRRPGRGDPVELVIGNGDHTCRVFTLTPEQVKSLARDIVLFALD